MKTLALIPARSGSKGVPGKNTRDFCGKPLWKWAVEVGEKTCDYVWTTSDDPEINGIPRPRDLALDETPMLVVVQHALVWLGYEGDVVVLLQPTQPLRTAEHVKAALRLLEGTGADSVASVVEIPAHYNPDCALSIHSGRLFPFETDRYLDNIDKMPTRRQDAGQGFSRDGTVYAIKREVIEAGSLYGSDCRPLIIPHSESCNIDTEDDWRRAESMKVAQHAEV